MAATSGKSRQLAKEEIQQAVIDPVLFSERILGHTLWSTPKDILRALTKPRARVAVKACHASGKTFTAGEAVAWFMTRYQDSIVPTTAPTWAQVKNLLWKEIHACVARSKIQYPPILTTDWVFTKEHYATGISTTEAERFQGFHAPHILIVIDEAPGVLEAIWEAIEGIEAGGDVRILALGNPTITSGRFYNAFTRARSGWQTFTIDAFDTPNMEGVTLEDLLLWEEEGDPRLFEDPLPYLTTRAWIVERWHEWGENSPLWQARVRGQFPRQSITSLISLSDVEAARFIPHKPGGRSLGVDVARYGSDYTAFTHFNGNQLDHLSRQQGRSTTQTFSDIQRWAQNDPALVVVVDDSGVGGGVVDMCRDVGISVIAFNAGNEVRTNQDVANRGSEAYWALSKSFEAGDLSFSGDLEPGLVDLLIEQLVSIEYRFDARQKIHVEKTGIKKDRPSPDLADSMNMGWEAHRVESNAPAAASLALPPDPQSGPSIRERPKLWSGWGVSGLLWGRNDTPSSPSPSSMPGPDQVKAFCPQCGQLASLSELGRTGSQRNFRISCKGCGYSQLIKQTADMSGSAPG